MKGSQSIKQGWKAYAQGDTSTAESEFSKAVDECPSLAIPALQQGLYFLCLDRYCDAARCFESAVSKEKDNPAPLFFQALALELSADSVAADDTINRLRELCPRHQGLTSLQLLREIRRGDPRESLNQLGFGEKRASETSWRVALAGLGLGDPAWLAPDLSSSPYLLGPILVEVEKRLLPREIPALEHRPDNLVETLDTLKRPERSLMEELKSLKNSWKAGPKLRKGRQLLEHAMRLADLAEQRTKLASAIAALEAGHSLDPFAFRAGFHLGEAYLFSAKGEPGSPYQRDFLHKAETNFVESVSMDGTNPYVLIYLAYIQQYLGRPQSAIDVYIKGTEKFVKMPDAHYGMGQCYLLLGQTKLAREFLLKAVSSDLLLARDRLNLFANLLQTEGPEGLALPLPQMPVEAPVVDDQPEGASSGGHSSPNPETPVTDRSEPV